MLWKLRYLDLAILIGISVWIGAEPRTVEPYVGFLVAFGAYIALDVKEQADRSQRSHDRMLFVEFVQTLPAKSMREIEMQDFAGFHATSMMRPLQRFRSDWNDVLHEFECKDLESKRKHLRTCVEEFLNFHAANTWSLVDNDMRRIPPEWVAEQAQRYRDVVVRLNGLDDAMQACYKDLVRLGRKKLGGLEVSKG